MGTIGFPERNNIKRRTLHKISFSLQRFPTPLTSRSKNRIRSLRTEFILWDDIQNKQNALGESPRTPSSSLGDGPAETRRHKSPSKRLTSSFTSTIFIHPHFTACTPLLEDSCDFLRVVGDHMDDDMSPRSCYSEIVLIRSFLGSWEEAIWVSVFSAIEFREWIQVLVGTIFVEVT